MLFSSPTTGPLSVSGNVGLVAGAQLSSGGVSTQPTVQQVPKSYFGSGVDLTATIIANTTNSQVRQYQALTVNVGVTLTTAGWPIYCQGTVTNLGVVSANGQNGVSTTLGGAGGAAGVFYGGGAGANGKGAAGVGNPGNNAQSPLDIYGGAGGAGGNGSSTNVGGAGGTVPVAGNIPSIDWSLPVNNQIGGGAGGGAGGASGSGTASGGGAGGVICIIADTFTGNGQWQANGGNGMNGSGSNGPSGGGGGGVVICVARTGSGSSFTVPFVNGGSPGVGGGVSAAQAGATGLSYIFGVLVAP